MPTIKLAKDLVLVGLGGKPPPRRYGDLAPLGLNGEQLEGARALRRLCAGTETALQQCGHRDKEVKTLIKDCQTYLKAAKVFFDYWEQGFDTPLDPENTNFIAALRAFNAAAYNH